MRSWASVPKLLAAACLLGGVAGSSPLTEGEGSVRASSVARPAAQPSSGEIASLIADLGVSKGGLHAPYCMPMPRSKADDAYERLLGIGSPAVPRLIEGLNDPSVFRRAHCAGLLGEVGDTRAVAPLCALVRSEERAKGWVIQALGRFPDPRSVEALAELLSEGSGETPSLPATIVSTGRQAANALAAIGAQAVPSLESARLSKDSDVRANARYALGLIHRA